MEYEKENKNNNALIRFVSPNMGDITALASKQVMLDILRYMGLMMVRSHVISLYQEKTHTIVLSIVREFHTNWYS